VCGTPQYMSPEQARGRDLDPRTDLYSTGVILYQMATGKLPFESDTPVGFLTKHIAEPPAPMRERNPELAISGPLEALIARALAKDREDRPASADAMRAELLACLSPPAPAPTRPQGGARRAEPGRRPPAPARRSPVVPIAIAVLVVGGGVGGWVAMRGSPATPPSTAAPTAPPAATSTSPPAPTPTAPPAATPTAAATPARPARDPQKARALFDRAEARRREMDAVGAIALYLKAEEADPQLVELHKKLGQCYQLLGDIPRARERYRKYLATGPADADAVRAALDLLR